jgi:RHS repeat-associated protein
MKKVINSCHTLCETTYDSCFDGCNGDPACEADCLSDQSDCYDVCDSNPDNVIFAGEVHNFLWGGSMHEPETDLYWMRNRYYHKGMKRFINQDPIGIWGDANNLGNGFAYVAGMVIEATDPTGLETEETKRNYPTPGFDSNKSFEAAKSEVTTAAKDFVGVSAVQEFKKAIKDKSIKSFFKAIGYALKFFKRPDPVGPATKSVVSGFTGNYSYKNEDGETVSFTGFMDGSSREIVKDKDGNEYKKETDKGGEVKYYEKNEKGEWVEIKDKEKIKEVEKKFTKSSSNSRDPQEAFQDQLIKNSLKKMLKQGMFEEVYFDPTPEWSDWKHVPVKIVFKNTEASNSKDPLIQILSRRRIVNKHTGELMDVPVNGENLNPFTNAHSLFVSDFNPGNIDPVFE